MAAVVDLLSARERRNTNDARPAPPKSRRRRRLLLLLIAGWTLFCAGQLALADFIARGELERHLRRMRLRYARRRETLLTNRHDQILGLTTNTVGR